jgi:hypothetical protein
MISTTPRLLSARDSSRSNSTKSPSSGAGNVSEPRVTAQVGTVLEVRVDRCVCAVSAVEVPISVCLGRSCRNVTEVGGPQIRDPR